MNPVPSSHPRPKVVPDDVGGSVTGPDDPRELARLLLLLADTIDQPGSVFVAGVLRRTARLVAELPAPPGPDQCQGCGAPLTQPRTGRRRRWCSDRCRRKHGGNASLVA